MAGVRGDFGQVAPLPGRADNIIPVPRPFDIAAQTPDQAGTLLAAATAPGAAIAGNRNYAFALRKDAADRALDEQRLAEEHSYHQQSLDLDRAKLTAATGAEGPAGPFSNKSETERWANVLATTSPEDPRYAVAFFQLYGPKNQQITDQYGNISWTKINPAIPPNTPFPKGFTPDDMKEDGAGGTGAHRPIDAEIQKGRTLLVQAEPLYKAAYEHFDALGSLFNQAAARGGDAGNIVQSADYQIAKNALVGLVQARSFAVSGQAAPEEEVARALSVVLPTIGDKAETLAWKKANLDDIIETIRRKGYPEPGSYKPPWTPGAVTTAPPAATGAGAAAGAPADGAAGAPGSSPANPIVY